MGLSFLVSVFRCSVQSRIILLHTNLLHSVTGNSKIITLTIFLSYGDFYLFLMLLVIDYVESFRSFDVVSYLKSHICEYR